MFTLLKAMSPWALDRAAGHTCAVGGVDPMVTPGQYALACQEIRMG